MPSPILPCCQMDIARRESGSDVIVLRQLLHFSSSQDTHRYANQEASQQDKQDKQDNRKEKPTSSNTGTSMHPARLQDIWRPDHTENPRNLFDAPRGRGTPYSDFKREVMSAVDPMSHIYALNEQAPTLSCLNFLSRARYFSYLCRIMWLSAITILFSRFVFIANAAFFHNCD
ncbi:uncharacterized protein [Dermacentor albipictus]|uniref:uncharacterized protein isoform X1 n=1 Tax=Dermacentor albipictus TaxID=60249 RepID=UPI0038FCE8F1